MRNALLAISVVVLTGLLLYLSVPLQPARGDYVMKLVSSLRTVCSAQSTNPCRVALAAWRCCWQCAAPRPW